MPKRMRLLFSRVPIVYQGAAILRLVWLRLTYSGGGAIAAVQLIQARQGLALDIGANRGQSAIRLARLKPEFNIVSFEPNRRCQFALRIVKAMLGKRFRFELAGLSDESGEVTYYEPYVNSLPVSAEGTFSPENFDDEMEERVGKRYEVRKTTFPVVRLDDLNLSPDFVKIDVQGSEMKVLKGACETLRSCHPVIVIEKNRHNERETIEYLAGLGYSRLAEENLRQSGHIFVDVSGDNVFVRTNVA